MSAHRFYLKQLQQEGLSMGDVAKLSNCTVTQVIDLICRRKPLAEDRLEKIARKMKIGPEDIVKMKHINEKVKDKYKKRQLAQRED